MLIHGQQVQEITELHLRGVKFLMDGFKEKAVDVHCVPVDNTFSQCGMCRLFFYAVLTYCALPITVTARSWSKNENFSLYGEKVREEKEGERRLWERCVNRFFGFPRFP